MKILKKKKEKKITKAMLLKKEKKLAKRLFREKLQHWKEGVKERDRGLCQICLKSQSETRIEPHHIIALQSVKRNYPQLLEDVNNGICLCSYHHKWATNSPHQGSFEFIIFLMKNKPGQYLYLKEFLEHYGKNI